MNVPLYAWRMTETVVNFGDYVSIPILESIGLKAVAIESSTTSDLKGFGGCLLAAGSSLSTSVVEKVKTCRPHARIIVWGSGMSGRDIQSPQVFDRDCVFLSVRGPVTKRFLKLPQNTPLGDPLLLLPSIFKTSLVRKAEVVSVPHWENYLRISPAARQKHFQATSVVNPMIAPDEWKKLIAAIASAQFVLTSSLHAAVTAQAFGIPWAVCLMSCDRLNFPIKWHDWFEFLGIEKHFSICTNLREAEQWWRETGSRVATPSMDPVRASIERWISSRLSAPN